MTHARSRKHFAPILLAAACAALALAWPAWRTELRAQGGYGYGNDHLTCYKVKDPLKIRGVAEIDTAQFGIHDDCKLRKSKFFCVPSTKESVTVSAQQGPVTILPVSSPPALTDYVCYRMRCKRPVPPDSEITDQFGNRVVRLSHSQLLCVPTVKGDEYCGDGVVNGNGEECDGDDDAACSGGCRSDCMCACERACCYIDSFLGPSCFEYTGRPDQIDDFFTSCPSAGSSSEFVTATPTLGRCTASPVTAIPCEVGVTASASALPTDTLCVAP